MNALNPEASLPGFSWKDRRVLVTGAGGFVGAWLSSTLAREGARVTALVKPGKAIVRGELFLQAPGIQTVAGKVDDAARLTQVLCDTRVDTVFHLAANNDNLSKDVSPVPIFETNIRGTWNLLEACRETSRVQRIVLVSSAEAGSAQESSLPGGGTELRPRRHPYPASKLAGELIGQTYVDTYGLPVAIARCENVYGGGDLNWTRLIPGTVRSILRGEAPVLRSDGLLRRDYVYVQDIVDGYLRLGARAADPDVTGRIFHFASGTQTSAREIVQYLCEIAGTPGVMTITQHPTVNERVSREATGEPEASLLGWSHQTELSAGLRSTLDWYRAHQGFGASTE